MPASPSVFRPARAFRAGWFVWHLSVWLCWLGICSSEASAAEPTLAFLAEEGVIVASNVPASTKEPKQLLMVHVVTSDSTGNVSDLPAVTGRYLEDTGELRFKPRFGFEPGMRYLATLHVEGKTVEPLAFNIPAPHRERSTVVAAIYPSADVVPENHLRFYLQFSAPMSRGFVYKEVRLLDAKGTAIDMPFLELDQELWDPAAKRLTLFFDPGRVKRGLKPHDEMGPVLVAGKAYTLEVATGFLDANGVLLKEPFRKTFRAAPVDYTQPDPEKWKISAPDIATKQALTVSFAGPIDHGMLQRMLTVINADGNAIKGAITTTGPETIWGFTPVQPWAQGHYRLRIDRLLEDPCGNSIARHFEILRAERTLPENDEPFVELAFEID